MHHVAYSFVSRLLTNNGRLDGRVTPVLRAGLRLGSHLAVNLQFGHVVDDAVQLPLRVDLGLDAQCEAA